MIFPRLWSKIAACLYPTARVLLASSETAQSTHQSPFKAFFSFPDWRLMIVIPFPQSLGLNSMASGWFGIGETLAS